MRRLFMILLILLVSIGAACEFALHPGYALFAYRQWVVQLPLWVAFLGIILVFWVLYTLLRLLAFVVRFNENWQDWWTRHRYNRSYDKTQKGLLALIEERWSSAERLLLSGIYPARNPVVNYLSAAEAAYAQRAFDRCDVYLQKAYRAAPQNELVIGLVQAKLQLEQGQMEQALATLSHLRQLEPYHPAVLRLQEKLYIRLADWQKLLELLPYLRKAKVIPADQVPVFEKNIYAELLDEALKKKQSIHFVRELWRTMPKKVRLHPDVLERYARLLKEDKTSAEEIEPLIRKILHKAWHADLVRLYGCLRTADPARQLVVVESWAKQYGKRYPLLLTLGRLSVRCQLWGKARYYLEEGLKQEASSEIQFELAKLLEQLGETSLALSHYKMALGLVAE
jgi:HemY protein